MPPSKQNHLPDTQSSDAAWKGLYKVGGATLLLTALIMPIKIIIFIIWPPPLEGTAIDWFNLFQENKFIGLLSMDILLIIDQVILIPSSLALYIVLRRSNQSLMIIALYTRGFIFFGRSPRGAGLCRSLFQWFYD